MMGELGENLVKANENQTKASYDRSRCFRWFAESNDLNDAHDSMACVSIRRRRIRFTVSYGVSINYNWTLIRVRLSTAYDENYRYSRYIYPRPVRPDPFVWLDGMRTKWMHFLRSRVVIYGWPFSDPIAIRLQSDRVAEDPAALPAKIARNDFWHCVNDHCLLQ